MNNDDTTIRRDEWLKGFEAIKTRPYMTDEERGFFKDAVKIGVAPFRMAREGIFETTFGYKLSRMAIAERMARIKKEMIESKELEEK